MHNGSPDGNGGSPGLGSLVSKIFFRTLDEDLVAHNENWLVRSGLGRELQGEGYRLRWVDRQGVIEKMRNGWEYVTVSHLLWWRRRIRRDNESRNQYLMKRQKVLQM
jgi:hypothetical protein